MLSPFQEDLMNVQDLETLRAPLDIPIPDPPPKDEEVTYLKLFKVIYTE